MSQIEETFDTLEFTEEYQNIREIAKEVIQKTAKHQGISEQELKENSIIPKAAVDEGEMDIAVKAPEPGTEDWNEDAQREWDTLRRVLIREIKALGHTVN